MRSIVEEMEVYQGIVWRRRRRRVSVDNHQHYHHHRLNIIIIIITIIIIIIIISPTICKFPEALSGGGEGGSVRIIQTWLARQPAGRPCKISPTITFVIIAIIITKDIISIIQVIIFILGIVILVSSNVCSLVAVSYICCRDLLPAHQHQHFFIAINILIIITTSIIIILGQSDPLTS